MGTLQGGARYYRPSGRWSAPGLFLGLACGAAGGAAAGFAHGFVGAHDSFVLLNMLSCVAAGCLAGLAARWGLRRGRVRSVPAALTVTVLTGVTACYASWVGWVYAAAPVAFEPLFLLRHPGTLWMLVTQLNETGTWGMTAGSPVNGLELWVVWAAEAALIAGLAAMFYAVASEPFCEECGCWCEKEPALGPLAWGDAQELARRLRAGDLDALTGRARAKPGVVSWFRADLLTCPRCRLTTALTVHTVVKTVEDPKDKRTNAAILVGGLLLDDAQARAVRQAAGPI